MRKLVSVALAGLCLSALVHAQEIPKDVVLPTETRYKNSPTAAQYPQANAVFLSDDVQFRANPDGTTVYEEHDVIKLFTASGVEDHKDLVRVYRSDIEKIEVLTARTILPDGRVLVIPAQAIRDEPVFEEGESKSNATMRRLVVRYPAAAPDCIVEFHLRTTRTANPGGKWWAVSYVQNPDPMLESRFTVEVPAGSFWRYSTPGLVNVNPEKTQAGDYERATWVVTQSPALTQELVGPGILTQMRRIEVTNFENWAALRSWFDGIFEASVDQDARIANQVRTLVTQADAPPQEKLSAIGAWANKKRFLTGGLEEMRPRKASELLEEKVLNPVDAAVLMAGLYRSAGFSVKPVLAFELPPEEMNQTLPRFNRVDNLLLQVQSGANSWWVDPRHPMEYAAHPPSGFQGGAILAREGDQPFEQLPITSADANRVITDIEARLDEKGKLELRFHTTEHGDSGTVYREASRELMETGKDERETNLQRLFERIARNYSARARVLERYFSLDAKEGEPIDFSATLSLPDYAVRLGEKMALPLPVRLNPQLVGLAESDAPRSQPVRLDHPWREEHRLRLHLPPGAQVNELPPTVQIRSPYGDYFATARTEGTEVFYYSRLIVNEAWVPQSRANELSQFARQVMAARAKPLVVNVAKTAQTDR